MQNNISMRYGCQLPPSTVFAPPYQPPPTYQLPEVRCEVCKKKVVPVKGGLCEGCLNKAINNAVEEAKKNPSLVEKVAQYLNSWGKLEGVDNMEHAEKIIEIVDEHYKWGVQE